MYKLFFKRILDLVIATLFLLIFSPLFILICILLYFANNGKPFFFQERPGKDEKIFRIVKFKSMNDKKDKDGNLLPDFQRMTAIGRFIRNTSLDEIPQLLNVIKGDMSLIGPRPLLISYLPLYNEEQKKRHIMRPGITGWAQVNGRNAISWQQKFQLDVYYITHCSFLLDLKILWMTFLKVIKKDGISAGADITMEVFKGNQHP